MARADKVFELACAWFRAAVDRAIGQLPAAQQEPAARLLWQTLGLANPDQPLSADTDLSAFRDVGSDRESLATAAQIAAEVLVALDQLRDAVAALDGGMPGPALASIGSVMRQVQDLYRTPAQGRYPSAFSLGKMLLTLSGDAHAPGPAAGLQGPGLARLLGARTAAEIASTQTALAWLCLVAGGMMDRSFAKPSRDTAAAMLLGGLPALGPTAPRVQLPLQPGGTGGVAIGLHTDAPTGLQATLQLGVDGTPQHEGQDFPLTLKASAGVTTFLPVDPPGPLRTSGDFMLEIALARSQAAGTLVIGPHRGASLRIGGLGVGLKLHSGAPLLHLFARQVRAELAPEDSFLKQVLGDSVALDFSIEAQADQFGGLRLQNGSGLAASLAVPTAPTGPFRVQLIHLGLTPRDGSFLQLQAELSASFGVELGPFQASIDRLGLQLELDCRGEVPTLAFALGPPSGIGLALDSGAVKGGGYLGVEAGGGYTGVLELQLLAVGVKAIALLDPRSEAGFSLLLLMYGQFPPVQLSFGFTLTGVGGLIGVHHTFDRQAVSQGLGNGALDSILFPKNPVAEAPRIIATLRTLFPVKKDGFVIGPMLELGWGTPSLVQVRMGLVIAPAEGTIAILGQMVVQLPPLVAAELALLRLQMDFDGWVTLDPLSIGCNAVLRNSRVGVVTITGQFAFRAQFGARPGFLVSAGGFHPRFKEVPGDLPVPFRRAGAAFDIGIVGISFKGYFAITSATVQMGSELRIWADLGAASVEGGWSFDAICELQPRFRFQVDLSAFLALQVFGGDLASVHVTGMLSGPGRWRIRGRGVFELPLLPDIHIDIDEAWGTDRDTPAVTVPLADLLAAEIGAPANWNAQLPQGGEACITVAGIQGVPGLLAHPLGTLVFQQKLVPLELRLDKLGSSRIAGANEFFGPRLVLAASPDKAGMEQQVQPLRDFFAAAQFLELSESERLDKPSFESLPAGYALRDSGFAMGAPATVAMGYEEADLGAALPPLRSARHLGQVAFVEALDAQLLHFGAAGRSSLRDKRMHQPPVQAAVRVQPAPVVATARATLGPLAQAVPQTSVWQASQALAATHPGSARRSVQVAEVAELSEWL
ncbi:DUF6603 domain-containing protein [Pseudorhodoferax aquiterrae]|uniref:DUF6603 domain-containing protein n=1 Tax=Pseudorhodoferax aquiterrae TaxID=747304 RepID=UPI00167C23C4|nr:DUF6603 domain-containing protein [Pseudorhodoferax aquiterrae]